MRHIFLDTGLLGAVINPAWTARTAACNRWVDSINAGGDFVVIPEIADYELRRELLRMESDRSIRHLNALNLALPFLPINSDAMRLAAQLWAKARRDGVPTADDKNIDGDAILAAQALQAKIDFDVEVIVATMNVGHLSRYVPADRWENILPSEHG